MIALSSEEQTTLKQILKSHGIDRTYKVLVFGSRATGKARKYSDIDLALIGKKTVPMHTRAQLDEAFEESDLAYGVDVVDFLTASEHLKSEIKQDGVELLLP